MALRINPTLNTFQERIIVGKAHFYGLTPSSLIKEAVGEMMKRMKKDERELFQRHYDSMTEEEKQQTISSK